MIELFLGESDLTMVTLCGRIHQVNYLSICSKVCGESFTTDYLLGNHISSVVSANVVIYVLQLFVVDAASI